MQASPVRVQWDPERDLHFNPLNHRSIQIGLSDHAVDHYIDNWITQITDVTDLAYEIGAAVKRQDLDGARSLRATTKETPSSKRSTLLKPARRLRTLHLTVRSPTR